MAECYPMWYERFLNARNMLRNACEEMSEAVYDDHNNARFAKFDKSLRSLLAKFDRQLDQNFKRGIKEGWAK